MVQTAHKCALKTPQLYLFID